jgi:hypothetical protein
MFWILTLTGIIKLEGTTEVSAIMGEARASESTLQTVSPPQEEFVFIDLTSNDDESELDDCILIG